MKKRCLWPKDDPEMTAYHDTEWGIPLHDDQRLFEFMILDTFQAGLSWAIILHKRENMRIALDDFCPKKIARYSETKLAKLLDDPGIIRNRAKIKATVNNAKAFLQIQKQFGSFDQYIWQWAGNVPKINAWEHEADIPTHTPESDIMSQELKKMGFQFVGSTICYAFMQAIGMVNDHLVSCFRHQEIVRMRKK